MRLLYSTTTIPFINILYKGGITKPLHKCSSKRSALLVLCCSPSRVFRAKANTYLIESSSDGDNGIAVVPASSGIKRLQPIIKQGGKNIDYVSW